MNGCENIVLLSNVIRVTADANAVKCITLFTSVRLSLLQRCKRAPLNRLNCVCSPLTLSVSF